MRAMWKAYQTPQQAWQRVTRYSQEYRRYYSSSVVWIGIGVLFMVVSILVVGTLVGLITTESLGVYSQSVQNWLPR